MENLTNKSGYIYLLSNQDKTKFYLGSKGCCHYDEGLALFDGYQGSAKLGKFYGTNSWNKHIIGFSDTVFMAEEILLTILDAANNDKLINMVNGTGILFDRDITQDELDLIYEMLIKVKGIMNV